MAFSEGDLSVLAREGHLVEGDVFDVEANEFGVRDFDWTELVEELRHEVLGEIVEDGWGGSEFEAWAGDGDSSQAESKSDKSNREFHGFN